MQSFALWQLESVCAPGWRLVRIIELCLSRLVRLALNHSLANELPHCPKPVDEVPSQMNNQSCARQNNPQPPKHAHNCMLAHVGRRGLGQDNERILFELPCAQKPLYGYFIVTVQYSEQLLIGREMIVRSVYLPLVLDQKQMRV